MVSTHASGADKLVKVIFPAISSCLIKPTDGEYQLMNNALARVGLAMLAPETRQGIDVCDATLGKFISKYVNDMALLEYVTYF